MDEFKRFSLRGLVAVVPVLFTVAFFLWMYNLIDGNLGRHVSARMLRLLSQTCLPHPAETLGGALNYGHPINERLDSRPQPGQRATLEYKVINYNALNDSLPGSDLEIRARPETDRNEVLQPITFGKHKLHLVGFLILIIVVYSVRIFLASFIGRTNLAFVETTPGRILLVRATYPDINQVRESLLGEHRLQSSGAAAVSYPQIGTWSMGLLAGPPMKAMEKGSGQVLATVVARVRGPLLPGTRLPFLVATTSSWYAPLVRWSGSSSLPASLPARSRCSGPRVTNQEPGL